MSDKFVGEPEKVFMGAGVCIFDSQQLGFTMNNGISITLEYESSPLKPDQSSIPLKDSVTGVNCVVDVQFANVSKDIMKLFPGGDVTGIKDPAGIDLRKEGKELMILPLDSADERVFRIPLATIVPNGAIEFAVDAGQVIPVQFKAYLESQGAYFMKFD